MTQVQLGVGQIPATPTTQPTRGAVSDGGRGDELASPIVDTERRVTFRVKAPQANSVSVTSDFQVETQMVKNVEGVWSVTVGPIDPEIYYYNFIVDGVRTIDPGNSLAKIGENVGDTTLLYAAQASSDSSSRIRTAL